MKIIATDLDGTLIPEKHKQSRNPIKLFSKLLNSREVDLIYITGRHKELIEKAMKKYKLPSPKCAIAGVGTEIYDFSKGRFSVNQKWEERLAKDWRSYKRKDIAEILRGIKELEQQEISKLNDFKQSYYVNLKVPENSIVRRIKRELLKNKIKSQVVYSVDNVDKVGLVDILPVLGNKYNALRFALRQLKVSGKDILVAGDSGNDVHTLTSGLNAVLVKNSSQAVKNKFKRIVREKGFLDKLYIAKGDFMVDGVRLNGNYSAGIIEGAFHFGIFS